MATGCAVGSGHEPFLQEKWSGGGGVGVGEWSATLTRETLG